MKPRKKDIEFVKNLYKNKVSRSQVIDLIHGTYLKEMDEHKAIRQRRIAAIRKVYGE